MSWSVEIQREEGKVVAGVYSTVPCAPICVLDCASERLDADNLRILIDSLHCALDIIAPHALDPAARYTCAICFKDAYHPKPHVCEKEPS